jgi:hypothetical protein
MFTNRNLNARPAPLSRLTDLKACKAFVEWLETKRVWLVKCEGTVFTSSPAEDIYKACDKVDDDLVELIGECGEGILGIRAVSTPFRTA